MVSPQLSTLKLRVDHLMIGLGALVLVGAGLWFWTAQQPDPAAAELDAGLERMSDRRAGRGSPPPRILRPFLASSSAATDPSDPSDSSDAPELPLTPPLNSDALGPEESVTEFREVMAELEDAVASDKKLSRRERAELYNRASGSFTAMSAWVDGQNFEERALMDDAFVQMRSLMRELDLEPPKHDPDHNPLRR